MRTARISGQRIATYPLAFPFAALGGEESAKAVRLFCFVGPFETKAVYVGDDTVAMVDATAKLPVELVAVRLFPGVGTMSMAAPEFSLAAFPAGK